MIVRQLKLGPMDNFVYLLADPKARECGVVDPAWDVPAILKAVSTDGWKLTKIFLTHHHSDHVNGLGELMRACEAMVYVHEKDAVGLPDLDGRLKTVGDREKVPLGIEAIVCLHTPGHTEGSQCLLAGDALLTGDTLFIRECGRVDLPGSDPDKLFHSLRKLAELPDDVQVFPGHDYGPAKSAPMGVERALNPYIQASLKVGVEEFRSLVL